MYSLPRRSQIYKSVSEALADLYPNTSRRRAADDHGSRAYGCGDIDPCVPLMRACPVQSCSRAAQCRTIDARDPGVPVDRDMRAVDEGDGLPLRIWGQDEIVPELDGFQMPHVG